MAKKSRKSQYLSWAKIIKKYPDMKIEIAPKKEIPHSVIINACQCKNGHVFDYRKRIRYPTDDEYLAPCQGRCPVCRTTEFTFMGTGKDIYPVRWNFLG